MIVLKKIKFKSLLKSIIPALLAASLGSIFVYLDYVDYDSLVKPFLNPPKIVFPIAWTIIYIACMVATYFVDSKEDDKELKQKCIINYYINMFINLIWTVSFFGLGQLVVGLIVLILLYFSTLSMFLTYRKVQKWAGNLIIIYLLWLLLALYLNICIVFLN